MNFDLIATLALLVICVFFFFINKPRMDIVALLALLALPLLGILNLNEALSGFSDSSVILIALMFVVGEGLVRTGVSADVGAWILKKAGGSETKLVIFMMAAVAIIGSVMSSTGIVALFIPVVLSICAKLNVSPSRLMMPLSFAGLISGMMSLVATPPNMVMDSVLRREGFEGFSFFSFTPIALIVLAAGIVYMIYARRFLGKNDDGKSDDSAVNLTLAELTKRYGIDWKVCVFVITPQSPFARKKVSEIPLRAKHRGNIVCIERRERLSRLLMDPRGETELREGDALLVDFESDVDVPALCELYGLENYKLGENRLFENAEREFGLVEVSVMPDSAIAGRTPIEANFRFEYRMNVIGILRKGVAISQNIANQTLEVGDMLLLAGSWKATGELSNYRKEFIVLNLPEESKNKTEAPGRALYALASLAVMIVLMITGIVPNALAALIGCLLLVATKCIGMDRAYRCINWSSLVLIIGMIPFAAALEKTGGVEIASNALVQAFGSAGADNPRIILGAMMAFTMIVGLFMSNTVTAVLLAPIAVTIAKSLNLDPSTFAMAIAIAASTSFMTPISSPVNTLVLGPGRYKFIDFVKMGVPFSIIVLIIGIIFIPIFFPFAPLVVPQN